MKKKTVLVIGAGGAVGMEIVRALRARGCAVMGAYRTPREGVAQALNEAGAQAIRLDLNDGPGLREALDKAQAAIFTPILTVSASAAPLLRADQPAVFFSSNNVAIDQQAEVYVKLSEAEKAVRAAAPGAIILRPTMIYGYPGDGNLSRLIAAMRNFPAIPIPAANRARQQPVFYKDLAEIAAAAIFNESMRGQTRAVAGPEDTSIRRLYELASDAAGVKTLLAPVPTGFFATLLGALEKAGLKLPVSAAQLARAGRDKIPEGPALLGQTPLAHGLSALAAALDDEGAGA